MAFKYYGLPQEIIDYIIDFLHNDKHALARCALVHQTWLHTSRYHLFSQILATVPVEVPPETAGYTFPWTGIGDPEHHLESTDRTQYVDNVLEFFKQDSNSHYRHFVRHVLVRGVVHRGHCTLDVGKIGEILALLPALRSFSILSVKLYPLKGSAPHIGRFRLKRLAISDVAAAPVGTLNKRPILDLLSFFSDIENLFVSDFYAGRVDSNALNPLPIKVQVSGLSAIRLRDFELLQNILTQSVRMDTVTSFSSTITHGDHLRSTNNLLRCFIPEKITYLEFDFRWIDLDNGRVHWNGIDLSLFTSLRSVRIHIPLHFALGAESLKISWTIMLDFFDILTMSTLTEVSIHLYVSAPRTLSNDESVGKTPLSSHPVIVMPDKWETMLEWDKLSDALRDLSSLRNLYLYVALRIDFGNTLPEPSDRRAYEEFKGMVQTNLKEFREKAGLRVSWQQETWPSLSI